MTPETSFEFVDMSSVDHLARDLTNRYAEGASLDDKKCQLMLRNLDDEVSEILQMGYYAISAGYGVMVQKGTITSENVTDTSLPFPGKFDEVRTVLAPNAPFILPNHTLEKSPVPALVFKIPKRIPHPSRDIFNSRLFFDIQAAIPLVGVPFVIEKMRTGPMPNGPISMQH